MTITHAIANHYKETGYHTQITNNTITISHTQHSLFGHINITITNTTLTAQYHHSKYDKHNTPKYHTTIDLNHPNSLTTLTTFITNTLPQ